MAQAAFEVNISLKWEIIQSKMDEIPVRNVLFCEFFQSFPLLPFPFTINSIFSILLIVLQFGITSRWTYLSRHKCPILVEYTEEGKEYGSGNWMRIIHSRPSNGRITKKACRRKCEKWCQLDIEGQRGGQKCIMLMFSPICQKMTKSGHIAGKSHSLKETSSQKPIESLAEAKWNNGSHKSANEAKQCKWDSGAWNSGQFSSKIDILFYHANWWEQQWENWLKVRQRRPYSLPDSFRKPWMNSGEWNHRNLILLSKYYSHLFQLFWSNSPQIQQIQKNFRENQKEMMNLMRRIVGHWWLVLLDSCKSKRKIVLFWSIRRWINYHCKIEGQNVGPIQG